MEQLSKAFDNCSITIQEPSRPSPAYSSSTNLISLGSTEKLSSLSHSPCGRLRSDVIQNEIKARRLMAATRRADAFGGKPVEEHRIALAAKPPIRLNRHCFSLV